MSFIGIYQINFYLAFCILFDHKKEMLEELNFIEKNKNPKIDHFVDDPDEFKLWKIYIKDNRFIFFLKTNNSGIR